MTENEKTVERYMEGFRKNDHPEILACLTDDVEWLVPGAFHVHGKEAFAKEIVGEGFVPPPEIEVTRMLEASDVVFAEGRVRTRRVDGAQLDLAMCDVFEMRGGKIRKLVSYIMPDGAGGP
jgi:ketosteroid isomerase-like protein